MNKDITVSNELLSWVFGYECEFVSIRNNNIEVIGVNITHPYIFISSSSLAPTGDDLFRFGYHINLHTFINIAKIKAFACGYDCTPRWDAESPFDEYKDFIFYANADHPTSCKDYDNYDSIYGKELHAAELEALEWVVGHVGGLL